MAAQSGARPSGAPARGSRDRLLAAAERLLLTEEYGAVSVRGICAAAGANPAAVHYHFGSKEALVVALLEDRLGGLWDTRLDELAARGAGVGEVVDAVIAPLVELAADPVGRLHLRLLARFVLGRHPAMWQRPWFRLDSWAGMLPGLDEAESRRRWGLAFDLILMRFGGGEPHGVESRGHDPSSAAVVTLRDFVVAGLSCAPGETR